MPTKTLLRSCLVLTLVLVLAGASLSADRAERKSLGKALLFSMLMPGAGEAYLGHQARARTMFVAEAGIWSAFSYFRIEGRMRENRYEEMARLFAGVEHEMDDNYSRIMAYYLSSEEYNVDVLREARLRYPLERDRQLAYFSENGYFGVDGWEWQDLSRMEEYSRVRTISRQSYRRAVLTTGFALLSRMVSVIDVYLSYHVGQPGSGKPRLGLDFDGTHTQSMRLYVTARF